MSNKVAVIGLDGMAWHLLSKLFEYGAMPTLKRLTENSLRGVLESTIPPFTPPAWTSIASGVNPGKHGVFDFTILDKNYRTRIVTSHDVYYPRIHEMVALKGLKSVCINQPLTYPLIRLKNTSIISDWIGPKVCYHPKSIEKYKHQYKPYTLGLRDPLKEKHHLSLFHQNTTKRVDAINFMMKQLDWELFWAIFSEPDFIFHHFYDSVLSGKKEVLRIFSKLDEMIEEAFKHSDLLVIVSDHGFSKYKYAIFPNCFLDQLGLIVMTQTQILEETSYFHGNVDQYTRPLKLPAKIHQILLIEPLRTIMKKSYKLVTGKNVKLQVPHVDPKNSKAYSIGGRGIHVKEKTLIRIIEKRLRKLNGILQTWTREEIYKGPYVDKAPHILFMPDEGYITGSGRVRGDIISKRTTYSHHPDGIIIINGRGMKSKYIERINTTDVVPTILNYLGLPLPNDTDGNRISDVPLKVVRPKTYNYLNHWQLTKKIHTVKRKLPNDQLIEY